MILRTIAIVFASAVLLTAAAWHQTEDSPRWPASPSCAAPEFHQFDFFAGDWDTYDVTAPTKVVARNHVTVILGGCVLHEVYDQSDGLRGESFSMYDAPHHGWHQTWVTNHGTLLLLEGRVRGDSMVLTGTETATDGTPSLLRGIWWAEPGGVREKAERSKNGGRNWQPEFDIVFRPHAGN